MLKEYLRVFLFLAACVRFNMAASTNSEDLPSAFISDLKNVYIKNSSLLVHHKCTWTFMKPRVGDELCILISVIS